MDGNQTGGNEETKFDTSFHLPYIILVILIVFMNLLVILLFKFNKSLRKPRNYLLISLSVSDLLTGLVGLPLLLVCSSLPICVACEISYPFIVFTSICTVLHILVISYERYFKIMAPFRVQLIGRSGFELKVVALVWFISVVMPLIPFSWLPPTGNTCNADMTAEVVRIDNIYHISLLTVFVGVPLFLLIFADISIFFVVRRQLNEIKRNTVGLLDSKTRLLKESRVLALMAIMMLYFIISWSFYYTGIIYYTQGKEFSTPVWLERVGGILRCTTPLVNPILYILLEHDFRRAVLTGLRQIFSKCGLQRSNENSHLSNGDASSWQISSRNVTERTGFL